MIRKTSETLGNCVPTGVSRKMKTKVGDDGVAEESEGTVCLKSQSWQSVKKKIQNKVSDYLK